MILKRLLTICTISILLCASEIALSAPGNLTTHQKHLPPFRTHNWLPTSLGYGIPNLHTRLLPESTPLEITLLNTTANTYIIKEKTDEAILLDGEVMVTALLAQWRLNNDWQASVFLPYIDHNSGIWDGLIEDWHDWFGLPQGGRRESTNNQFGYYYRKNGEQRINYTDEAGSTGDIQLGISRKASFSDHTFLLQFGLKAPTGDAGKFTGSGAWDFSAGIGWQKDLDSKPGAFSPFAGAAVTLLGESDFEIASAQRSYTISGRAGLHWHVLPWLSLTTQLDSHSPLYDSQLKALGGSTLQFTFGGHLFPNEKLRFDISAGEDLSTLVTPDFVVNLAVAYRF